MNRRDAYISRKAASAWKQRLIGVTVIAGAAGFAVLGLMVEPDHAIAARSAMAQPAAPVNAAPGAARPAPASAPAAAARRVYPYSIIPGGVSGKEELASVIKVDKVVAAHYASFDVAKAVKLTVQKPRAVYVSYRKGDQVYWTSRKLMLVKGEMLLSDGRNEMRARCANRISDTPMLPVEKNEPSAEELDAVMAVSMDLDELGLDQADAAGRGFGTGLGPASDPLSAPGAGRAGPDMGPGRSAPAGAKPATGRATTLNPVPSDGSTGSTPETPVVVAPPQGNIGEPGNTPGTPPLAGGGTPAPSPELSPPPSGGPATPGPDVKPPNPPAPPGANPPAGIPPAGIPPDEIPDTPLPPPLVPEPPVFPPTDVPATPGEPEQPLPEPGTLALCAAALAGILLLRRRQARSKRRIQR